MSCGKCVLGSYFFLYHKSITIKVSWAGQDLACTPETVEGSLFIETVLPLHLEVSKSIHCDSQYAW